MKYDPEILNRVRFTYPAKGQPRERMPFPKYHCFCCRDRGIVHHRWILVLAEHHGVTLPDFPQLCQANHCRGRYMDGAYYRLDPLNLLRDIDPVVCDYFHRLGLEEWEHDCQAFAAAIQAQASATPKPDPRPDPRPDPATVEQHLRDLLSA